VLDESELPERVRALPGMDRILPALASGAPSFLVGGAVRDLLLGRDPVDIDVAVEGDAEAVAERLAKALEGEVTAHERFGTATVVAGGVDVVNLAQTRCESYAEPGALPDVEPAGLPEDLSRRDFTINALALALGRDEVGALSDPLGGRGDLSNGLIRVLHPASFSDDPTRLLRAVRYAARLGFTLEEDTERWARSAAADSALKTVSGSRIRDELIDLLAENEAPQAVELMRDLGIDGALHPDLRADPELVASAKLGAAETGADPALAALAALCDDAGSWDSVATWIDRLGLAAGERDAVLRAAQVAPGLVGELRRELRPSELHALLDGEPSEALALALALGAPAEPVLDFVGRLSMVCLEITGEDLLAAGLPESPVLGRALEATLARKLDGEVDGRDEELSAALDFASADGAR
jgi:tRNA nucleotidyltransferase (CCA-adding enzyme)